MQCSDPDCAAIPTTPSGAWRPVSDRRWWCPDHKHRAQPGDDLPPEPTYFLSPTGGLRLNPNSEEGKRVRREDERRREEERQRREADEREGAALEAVRDKYEEEATISILGHRVHPGDIRVGGK